MKTVSFWRKTDDSLSNPKKGFVLRKLIDAIDKVIIRSASLTEEIVPG